MCVMWAYETWCSVEFIIVLLCSEMTVTSVEGMHSLAAESCWEAYAKCERVMNERREEKRREVLEQLTRRSENQEKLAS